jgi:16S rRNA (guanine527-N7)-methyltransferase
LVDPALIDALRASQRLGMLGGRSIYEVVDHASAFVAALADVRGLVVDLGAGGGVPGLVIAAARPDLRLVLVDRRATRTDHLRRGSWVRSPVGDVDRGRRGRASWRAHHRQRATHT